MTKYIGETSRSVYKRTLEHMDGLRKAHRKAEMPTEVNERNNPLYKHQIIHHRDTTPEYWVRVINTHQTAMPRQIEEAVLIDHHSKMNDVTMNSKSEWKAVDKAFPFYIRCM